MVGKAKKFYKFRRGVRVAEGARLESVYTFIAYRGFESLSLRQFQPVDYGGLYYHRSTILLTPARPPAS